MKNTSWISVRFALATLVATLVGAIGLWWWSSPLRWIRQAEVLLISDPLQADTLATAALEFGTKSESRAWLVRCRAQLALKNPVEALGAFSQIKYPEQCPVNDWCALIEDARSAEHFLLTELAMSQALRLRDDRLRVLALVLPELTSTLPENDLDRLLSELRALVGNHAEGWQAIGLVEKERGYLGNAVVALRKSCELTQNTEPIGLSCRRNLAQLLIDLGQYDEAQELVKDVMKASTPTITDWIHQALLKRFSGNPDECLDLLNKVLIDSPAEVPARLLRGTVLVELDRLREAQEEFERCLQIAPFHAEAHYRLAQTLIRQGDQNGAAPHLQEQRRLALLQSKVIDLRRRISNTPNNQALMEEMATLFEALGQPQRASSWRKEASVLRSY